MTIPDHTLHRLILTLLLLTAGNVQAALPPQVNGQPLPTLAPMLEKVTPAVVNISAIGEIQVRTRTGHPRRDLFNEPFFRHFFNLPRYRSETRKTRSLGSGVVVDAGRGYVLSNHHVIEDSQQIIVTFKDGRQLEARLIGSDPRTDVAVLQISADNLTAVPISDSDRLRVGDFAIAIGNPFGLGQTVTSGIVSALGRSGLGLRGEDNRQNYEEFIQTDAAINIGNSGGALVNLRGELIGINTAILSPNRGGSVGIGFAIPINMAKAVMQQLITHGEIRRGYFGIVIQTLTPALAEAMQTDRTNGAIIAGIESGSPAEQSGIQVHDIVTAVNGQPVKNAIEMRNRIGLLNIGDAVTLQIHRGDRKITLTATISDEKHTHTIAGEKLERRLAGAMLTDLPADRRVLITAIEPGTPAAEYGLEKGDAIISVNRKRITGIKDIQAIIRLQPDNILINIQRGQSAFFLLLR